LNLLKTAKRMISCLCTCSLIINFSASSIIFADKSSQQEDTSTKGLGCLSNNNSSAIATKTLADFTFDRASLPTSTDLSIDTAFPPIGDQGDYNSCVAWATTYYAYTYMVHYEKGISSTYDNAYSPRWTYNMINGGLDCGSYIDDAIHVLEYQGALTMTDCPYLINDAYSFDWPHNTQAMINALSTRAYNDGEFSIPTTYGSNFENSIDVIKFLLDNNTPCIVSAKATPLLTNGTWKICKNSANYGQNICVRNAKTTSSGITIPGEHTMTVVGYNNNVWCDVNGNNIQDAGETGAFKIANSWGTTWKDMGYAWILYDSLLSTSRIKHASYSSLPWDYDISTYRDPFFACGGATNDFCYFSIQDYTVGLVSEVTITTDRRNQLSISSLHQSGSFLTDQFDVFSNYSGWNFNNPLSFNGTLVINHPDSENIPTHLSGYSWGTRISDTLLDSHAVCNVSCKIVDDLDNTIQTYCTNDYIDGTYHTHSTPLNLNRGDVDYSNILTLNDADIITDYIAHIINLSNVQKVLADYNNDGLVDLTDVTSLKLYLASKGIDISPIDEKLNRYIQQGLIDCKK
jgi:C1A family cysteine protease